MIRIGICDDNIMEQNRLKKVCLQYCEKRKINMDINLFSSGEEVLEYCCNSTAPRIDLLFLDIEMQGISGLELKEQIKKVDSIWRIVFVSSHTELMEFAFGLKILGFMRKPIGDAKICNWIEMVINELEEEVTIRIEEKGILTALVRLENIEYFKGEGNFTKIVIGTAKGKEEIFSTRSLKSWEKELMESLVVRVHKSYLVNLINVMKVDKAVLLRYSGMEVPIGRVYREEVREKYNDYLMNKMRKRVR